VEIFKEFRFEAAHHLPHHPEGHKCRRPARAFFRVEVYVAGPLKEPEGWVADFADLTVAWGPLHAGSIIGF